MAQYKKKSVRVLEERKADFMLAFSKEAQQVRDSIVKDLPAYNSILSIHAESFEEVALRCLAAERNIPFDKTNPPLPACPFCGNEDRTHRKEAGIYICRACNKTFSANYNSIVSGTKCDAIVWMKLLHCLLEGYTLKKSCDYCEISENIYYNLRTRIFYAMSLMLSDLKLYGNIQVDNTFVRTSFKGMDLQIYDYPENSPFQDNGNTPPRLARNRGGSFFYSMRNSNYICVFAAIDDSGHVLTRFAGVGVVTHKKLLKYVPKEHYLLSVPQMDPFAYCVKKPNNAPSTKAGDKSLMVADREGAIAKYANEFGIAFESHKYRADNAQLRLSSSAHNIQRVNALHHRLKAFLRESHYVSSKYLPGYLTLFEFIENTGATQDAIAELFKILATPGLGKPAVFFRELFSVPNYLIEWFDDDNPLRKIPPAKLLAFYLYDHVKHKEYYGHNNITMGEIEKETGYTAPTIRKFHREFEKAGYREMILKHCEPEIKGKPSPAKKHKNKKIIYSSKTFNPVVLAMYDEYAKVRLLPADKRPTAQEFLDLKNKEYGTNYKLSNIKMKFKEIEAKGIREPLPPLRLLSEDIPIPPVYIEMTKAYDDIVLSYREKGAPVPKTDHIFAELGKLFGVSGSTARFYVTSGRSFLKKQKEQE